MEEDVVNELFEEETAMLGNLSIADEEDALMYSIDTIAEIDMAFGAGTDSETKLVQVLSTLEEIFLADVRQS